MAEYDKDDQAIFPHPWNASHDHVTRDIKPKGSGCPACENYHVMEELRRG